MLNNDKSLLPVDQPLAESDPLIKSVNHPVESTAQTSRKRKPFDAASPTKPHRNTGRLDSLGGGRLP